MRLRWLWLRSQIPRDVRAALESLRSVPEPDAAGWESGREAFLGEVRASADVFRERCVSSELAITSKLDLRRNGWKTVFKSFFSLRSREVSPMMVALKVLLMLALAAGGSVGTVGAARESLPGSPLYGIKMQLENWELGRTETPGALMDAALMQAQNRVEEAARLANKGLDVPDEVVARYQERLSLALQASGTIADDATRLQTRAQISEALGDQLHTMAQITASEGGDDDAIASMVRTMEQAQARIGQSEDAGNSDAQSGPGGRDDAGEGNSYGPGAGDGDGEADTEGSGYGPGGDDDAGEGNSYGPGDGEGDSEPDADGDGYGPGDDDDAGEGNSYGPGDGEGDGEPDADGDGYAPGGDDDAGEGNSYGDGEGDGEPDADGDGYGPGGDDDAGEENSYGPGDGDGEGEPDADGDGDGPGGDDDVGEENSYGPGDGDGDDDGAGAGSDDEAGEGNGNGSRGGGGYEDEDD